MATMLTVHDPRGYAPKVEANSLAPSLDTLEGKSLYLVDGRFNGAGAFMEEMQGWFARHMPGVNTVSVDAWR